MSGLRLVLNTLFTDTSLPILRDDPVLAPGALALFDASVDTVGGVAAHAIPNIAYNEAKALIPAGTQASLSHQLRIVGAPAANTQKIERTTKGGIHIVNSQTNAVLAGTGTGLEFSDDVKAYLFAHMDNAYYLSAWWQLTRINGSAQIDNFVDIMRATGGVAGTTVQQDSNLFIVYSGGSSSLTTFYAAGAAAVRNVAAFPNSQISPSSGTSLATRRASARKNGWSVSGTGGNLVSSSEIIAGFFSGAIANNYARAGTALSSSIFYRLYLEDLTVSGRSYTTVDALDQAEYTKAFSANGRFYGDTFTAPATLCP